MVGSNPAGWAIYIPIFRTSKSHQNPIIIPSYHLLKAHLNLFVASEESELRLKFGSRSGLVRGVGSGEEVSVCKDGCHDGAGLKKNQESVGHHDI